MSSQNDEDRVDETPDAQPRVDRSAAWSDVSSESAQREPTEASPEPPPQARRGAPEPVVVPRWVQAIAAAAALLGLASLARSVGSVLLIFLVAAIVALILNPWVSWLQRHRVPRGIAISVVFVTLWAVLAGTVALLVRPVTEQVQAIQRDLPGLVDSANSSLAGLQAWLDDRGIGVQVKRPGQTGLETLQDSLLSGSTDVLGFTRGLVARVAEGSFVLVLILVIAIYMLVYGQQIGNLTRRVMPPGVGTAGDDYPTLVQHAVSGYVRGQAVFSLVMGFSAGVALWLFGVLGIFPAGRTFSVFFGVFYGLMELIPYVGPVLGAAPPILVALLQGDPLTVLWLVLLFIGLQQIEGHVVAPTVFGHHLRINPLLVILALLVGGHLHGIPGALVALPLAAVARVTVLYLRRHLVLEPWGTPTAAALRAPPPPPPMRSRAQPARPQGPAWPRQLAQPLKRRPFVGRNPLRRLRPRTSPQPPTPPPAPPAARDQP